MPISCHVFNNDNISVASNCRTYRPSQTGPSLHVTKSVLASTYVSLARRSKQKGSKIQLFEAALADVVKVLKPQPKLSLAGIVEQLLEHYRAFAQGFDLEEAIKLPPHWPGIDQGDRRSPGDLCTA